MADQTDNVDEIVEHCRRLVRAYFRERGEYRDVPRVGEYQPDRKHQHVQDVAGYLRQALESLPDSAKPRLVGLRSELARVLFGCGYPDSLFFNAPLAMVVLCILESVGGAESRDIVEHIAFGQERTEPERKLVHAALKTRTAISSRLLRENQRSTLLRPATVTDPESLLKPASAGKTGETAALLSPAEET